jgi:hypothetical protein
MFAQAAKSLWAAERICSRFCIVLVDYRAEKKGGHQPPFSVCY